MKRYFLVVVLVALITGLCAPPVFAQAMGTVKGTCKDVDGNPITGAVVRYVSTETGRKYELKTNNKGEFFSLGVSPGKYNVTLMKDGKELFHVNGAPVTLDDENNVLEIDLQKEQERTAKGAGLTPEQLKQQKEAQEKAQKEQLNVKALNEKLKIARDAIAAGTPDVAVQAMTEATQLDATKDLLWFTLGDAYSAAGKKLDTTDRAAAKPQYEQAATAYQKAIDLKPTADYYNNLGQAQSRVGKTDDAVKSYNQAAQLDPTRAGMFYFNLGAILTNNGKVDEAIEAFKKAIAADPTKADAYYWLGVNLIGKEVTDKDNKVIAPPGTAEAFQKYLELQPTGQFADGAKAMLASIGSTVETTYGTKKKSTKTK